MKNTRLTLKQVGLLKKLIFEVKTEVAIAKRLDLVDKMILISDLIAQECNASQDAQDWNSELQIELNSKRRAP